MNKTQFDTHRFYLFISLQLQLILQQQQPIKLI